MRTPKGQRCPVCGGVRCVARSIQAGWRWCTKCKVRWSMKDPKNYTQLFGHFTGKNPYVKKGI